MFRGELRKSGGLALIVALMLTSGSLISAQTKKKPKYLLAADTIIRVRMNDKLSSKNAQVGNTFTTTVVTPVYAKGVQVIPAGAIVTGHVTHVERASRKSNAGSLNVTFTQVEMPNGVTHPLTASLSASESADNEGEPL